MIPRRRIVGKLCSEFPRLITHAVQADNGPANAVAVSAAASGENTVVHSVGMRNRKRATRYAVAPMSARNPIQTVCPKNSCGMLSGVETAEM